MGRRKTFWWFFFQKSDSLEISAQKVKIENIYLVKQATTYSNTFPFKIRPVGHRYALEKGEE
jgi:hypothetical protein